MMAANEALSLGYGGISQASRVSGLSRVTITKAIKEMASEPIAAGRTRNPGGGCQNLVKRDPDLPRALENLVEPLAHGDPESPLRWTCKSTRVLARELTAQEHPMGAFPDSYRHISRGQEY